jgi:TatA/E family protein of Tat protein translocase
VFNFLKNIGPAELIIIVLVIGGLFGSKKAKELAEGLGKSAKELKKVKVEIDNVKSDVT